MKRLFSRVPVHIVPLHSVPHHFWVPIALALLTVLTLGTRWAMQSETGIPGGDTEWKLTMDIRFSAQDDMTIIRLSPPWDTRYARIIGQRLIHPGLKIRRASGTSKATRKIVAQATDPGKTSMLAEYTIQVSSIAYNLPGSDLVNLSPENRELYLNIDYIEQIENQTLTHILSQLTEGEPDKAELQENIFQHLRNNITYDQNILTDDPLVTLESRHGNAVGMARAMVTLCRINKIPARLVTGFILQESFDTRPHTWLEVYDDNSWIPYDIANGYQGELPPDFLPVVRGEGNIFTFNAPIEAQASYEISPQIVASGMLGHDQKRLLDVLDLTRLPLNTRSVLAIVLLLPLGALFTAFCGQVVGIRSYGTFTPSFLALAIIYSDWLSALVLVAMVAAIGLTGRSLIPGKPSRLPRLTMIYTLIAISMALSISVLEYFNLNPDGAVVLLPIVILTMLVDRVYSVTEEAGARIALTRLTWTCVIACICYLIFQLSFLGHMLLAFPESHFITLAVSLLLGTYTGKKLKDLKAFRWLGEPEKESTSTGDVQTKAP